MSIQFPNLGINLDYVGKSIRIFGFEITFFGLLIAAGMLLGLGFIVLEARRCGEKEDDYLEMMILSLVTGVIGARALYVCFSWNLYTVSYTHLDVYKRQIPLLWISDAYWIQSRQPARL